MNAAINGAFVVIPTGAARIPDKASVKACHQLHTVEEIHARDTRRLAVQQHKSFFEVKQSLMHAQAFAICITAAVAIHATMGEIIVKFDIARAVTYQRRRPRYKAADGIVGAGIGQEFPVIFATHTLAARFIFNKAIGIAIVALAYVSKHVFKINALTSIQLRVAIIKGQAHSQFRQECSILQVAASHSPQKR